MLGRHKVPYGFDAQQDPPGTDWTPGSVDHPTEMAADVTIEAIVFAVQAIPRERHIGALFQAGETEVFSRDVTSSMAVEVGAGILRGRPVDWSEIGVADDELEGLAEILMRLFVSFLQYPADPPRSEDEAPRACTTMARSGSGGEAESPAPVAVSRRAARTPRRSGPRNGGAKQRNTSGNPKNAGHGSGRCRAQTTAGGVQQPADRQQPECNPAARRPGAAE